MAASDIKIAHSIFALPFAIYAAFLARPPETSWSRFAAQLGLVVVCMVFARTWAMLVNRLVDRRIDAVNRRTSGRVFASGKVSTYRGWLFALGAAALFVGCAALFRFFGNNWPLILAVPVLAWIAFYSLTKRFTWLCHLFLGGALAVSPLASALAVEPSSLASVHSLYWISAFVLLWVAGFDIIYALQDMDFDREHKLWSIPAKLGEHGALWTSRALHAMAVLALLAALSTDERLGVVFASGIAIVAVLLVFEHVVASRRGRAGLNMAFFTVNGVVSCLLGAAGVVDVL